MEEKRKCQGITKFIMIQILKNKKLHHKNLLKYYQSCCEYKSSLWRSNIVLWIVCRGQRPLRSFPQNLHFQKIIKTIKSNRKKDYN